MSEKNGDKARFQKNRKRVVQRRASARTTPPADGAAPKRFAKAKTTPPKGA